MILDRNYEFNIFYVANENIHLYQYFNGNIFSYLKNEFKIAMVPALFDASGSPVTVASYRWVGLCRRGVSTAEEWLVELGSNKCGLIVHRVSNFKNGRLP